MSRFGTIINDQEVKPEVYMIPAVAPAINISVEGGNNTFVVVNLDKDATINIASGSPSLGDRITIMAQNDAVAPWTLTFGTLFISSGPTVGVVNSYYTVQFKFNGVNFIEISRAQAV
jgi:hypothetical protein